MATVDEIGATAGRVWRFLSTHGPATLYAVEKEIDAPKALVAMSLGWLAREGKLRIESEGRVIHYSLTT